VLRMSKCRPSKWVIPAIVGAGLPLLCAYAISSKGVVDDVNARATAALGADWAKVVTDGRDATISGTAPSQEALDAAVKAVAGTYGVRTVAQNMSVAPPPPPPEALAAPTVESVPLTNMAMPTFKGTWPEGKAAGFDVKIGDDTYTWGKSPELKSDGAGNWTLTPSKPLAEGMVHVMPEVTDAAGALVGAAAMGMATVDLTPPAVPTLAPAPAGAVWPYAISGTWAEEPGAKLSANLNGTKYELGGSPALTSDGKGNFVFDPKVDLKPGSYDIDFTTNDAAGNSETQTMKAAIVIAEAAPAPTPAPVKPKPLKIGVTTYAASADGRTITGRWSEGVATSLTATLNGREYVANRGAALTTDGKGMFTFAPAAKLAPGTYPVEFKSMDADGRTVTATSQIVIAEPAPPPPAPPPVPAKPKPLKIGVTTYAVAADGKTIAGRWSEGVATSLTATLNGREYVANRGAALTTDGKGMFTFAPAAKLAPGTYPVEFKSRDAEGRVVTATSQIVIAEPPPPPAPPKIEISADAMAKGNVITGKWSEGVATSLTATLNGREYVANRGAALTTDGKGVFTFAPAAKLAPGTYPVEFKSTDGTGQVVTAKSQIVIAEAPKVAAPAPKVVAPPPKPKMAVPTVTKQLDLTGAPVVHGTWPNNIATLLTITLNGKTYEYRLGDNGNIHTHDREWSLLPSAGLKDGIYDVVVTATDETTGMSKKDETVAELEVDAVQPAAPTVAAYEGVKSPEAITGTWDAKEGKGLKVSVAAIKVSAELGAKDSALTSDGDGNWTMKLVTPLAPGKYDINAESTDIRKRVQIDVTAGEVVITAPPPAPAGYDCLAVLKRVDAIFPIRFAFDHDNVQHPYDLTLQYYAAVLKDQRCANVKVEVAGHADFHGSERYNQGLSERRAQTIIDMLAKDGIDTSRLVKKGYSKDKPLDPARTDEARMKNRRVEITATSN
jgi:outer membrane protein OmpA-like peptidoglycan-associated protein